jgi:hypothetical protein
MAPDSPIIAFGFGESNPPCLHYPGCYAGYVPNSICDSLSCPTQIELVESNIKTTFQQDYTAFPGAHFACLAIFTRHSSLTSPLTWTPDPQRENPAQNDPKIENIAPNDPQIEIFTHDESDTEFPTQNATTKNPKQNNEISTETCTE